MAAVVVKGVKLAVGDVERSVGGQLFVGGSGRVMEISTVMKSRPRSTAWQTDAERSGAWVAARFRSRGSNV